MATNFPEELDSFLNPLSTDSVAIVSHAAQHSDSNDAIEALQVKLGANNSTDTSSIDYRIKALEDQPFDSEAVRDAIDLALVAGSGITKVYDDVLDTLTLSIDTSVIQSRVENVTDTEIGYLDGVTSPVQTQINAKLDSSTASLTYAPIASPTFTGTVGGITKSMVGLANVDNTTDALKPVSTATQNAINLKASLDSPILTGAPAAPTAATGTNTTQIATTAFVKTAADGAVISSNDYTDEAIAGLGNSLPNTYVPISDIGVADGIASLNSTGKVPDTQLDINERIQDVAAKLITDGTHTNISVSYNDQDGKLSFTGSAPQLTQEEIQDYVAPLFNHALHTNITATYDDQNNKILLTSSSSGGSLTQEQVQDFVAPLLNHSYHTNITASYDDANNRITLQGNSGGGGASVIISSAPPNTPRLGDIWLDSDNGKTHIWDGAYWIEVGGSSSQAIAAVNSIPPSSPVLGSIWMNSSTAKTYIYDGSFWAQI
jgi:hypothetical protein